MKKFIFATHNAHKLNEVRAMMPSDTAIMGLRELAFHNDVPETSDTLEGNALQKARYIGAMFGQDCFADDTGLEVEALDGRPSVHTARYAGPSCNSDDNLRKLLAELSGQTNRRAQFRTVVALIIGGREYLFHGIVHGHISETPYGTNGFGYDPVFVPLPHTQTFAQLDSAIKNAISHRALAIAQLVEFLAKYPSE